MTEPTGRNILDDGAAMGRADSGDMLGHIARLADHVRNGWRATRDLQLPWQQPTAVAILGVGGSGVGPDLARGIFADRVRVPVEVLGGFELPAWVGPDTLVIASSHSGDTVETLRQLEVALARRCPVVAMTGGGALRRVSEAAHLPLALMPGEAPTRATLGWSLAMTAGILERAGVLELGEDEVEAAVRAAEAADARFAPAVPTAQNPAKQLAWSLVDRYVVVVAGDFLAPVARRWKMQLNLNAKTAATWEGLPEATHATVVGFEQPESLRDHLAVVMLGSTITHPSTQHGSQLIGDLVEAGRIWHTTVALEGEDRFGQALAAVVQGDYVSVYLAFMYAVDPTPTELVGHIREQLSLADQAADA